MNRRRIFVIGDSISIHYGPYLKQYINYKYDYDRKRGLDIAINDLDNPVGANAGDSSMILEYLEEQYKKSIKYDVLLINCGAHDVRRSRENNEIQVSLSQYKDNLNKIVSIAKKMSNKLIWITTTPIIDKIHNARKVGFLRYEADVEEYNEVAKKVMIQNEVEYIDLHSFVKTLGNDIYIDHVHFVEEIRKLQAAFIAGYLD